MRIGVIGGGIAGLSAAYELLKQGHEVHLYERSPFLGGQVVTVPVADTRIELAYHHLFTSDVIIQDLMAELGIGELLEWHPSSVGWFKDGKVYPFVTPMDLLRFSPLKPWNRLRLGLAVLFLQKYDNWRRLEGTTAERWMRRWAGNDAYENVWEPLMRGKFGARKSDISMAWLWGKIHLRTTSRRSLSKEVLGYPRGSFSVIVDALERAIRARGGHVHTAADVEAILTEAAAPGRLRAVGLRADGREERFDRIISTIPSNHFLSIAPPLGEEYERKLRSGQYQAAICMLLTLKRPLSATYWMNIGEAGFPFVALIEHTNFVPADRYGGKTLLYVSNYLSPADEYWSKSDDELLAAYTPFLQRINPEFSREWAEDCRVFREPAAQPIVPPGYSAMLPELQTPVENLILANTTQIYPEDRGTNYSVRLGRLAAAASTAVEAGKDEGEADEGRDGVGSPAATRASRPEA